MAGELSQLVVTLRGDSSHLATAFKKAEGDAQGFGSKFGSIMGGLGKAAALGAAGATAALVGIGTAAISSATQASSATNKLAAQLGLTKDEARELGDTAIEVFRNNFGGSIAEAGQAVSLVAQQFQGMSAAATGPFRDITENAFRLRDAFGVELPQSVDAVKTLMQNFGLTSQQAFDLITAGFQSGLNRSGDFLESVTEYAPQFGSAGATAQEFFSLMDSGLQGGVLGTDKAADAFKEFVVRIQDGSKSTAEGLKMLGIDAEALGKQMASGQVSAAQAFELVMENIRSTDDLTVQYQAGVALLGTQFEDLGAIGASGLSLISEKFTDVAGKTKDLDVQYESLGAVFEGLKRKAIADFLIPLGEKLLDIINGPGQQFAKLIDSLLSGDFEGFKTRLSEIGKEIETAAKEWGKKLTDWVAANAEPMLRELGQLLEKVVTWGRDEAAPAIGRAVAEWGAAFLDWVEPRIGPLLQALGGILSEIGGWILTTALPEIAEGLKGWGAAFIDWVKPQIGPLLTALGELLADLGSWIVGTAGPEIGAKIVAWAIEFRAWVGPAIDQLMERVGELTARFAAWSESDMIPAITAQTQQWGEQLKVWVPEHGPGLLAELNLVLANIQLWLAQVAGAIAGQVLQWGLALVSWVAPRLDELIGELAKIKFAIERWGVEMLIAAQGLLVGVGAAIIRGLVSGIVSAFPDVRSALGELTDNIPKWKDEKRDPTLLTPTGKTIALSLIPGFKAAEPDIKAALGETTDFIADTMTALSATFSPAMIESARAIRQAVDELRPWKVALAEAKVELLNTEPFTAAYAAQEKNVQILEAEVRKRTEAITVLREYGTATAEARTAVDGFTSALQHLGEGGKAGLELASSFAKALTSQDFASGEGLAKGVQSLIDAATKAGVEGIRQMGESLKAAITVALREPTPENIAAAQQLWTTIATQTDAAAKERGTLSAQTFSGAFAQALANDDTLNKIGASGQKWMEAIDKAVTVGGEQNIQTLARVSADILGKINELPPQFADTLYPAMKAAMEQAVVAPTEENLATVRALMVDYNSIAALIPKSFADQAPEVQQAMLNIAQLVKDGALLQEEGIKRIQGLAELAGKAYENMPAQVAGSMDRLKAAVESGAVGGEQAAKRFTAVAKLIGDDFEELPPVIQAAMAQVGLNIENGVPGAERAGEQMRKLAKLLGDDWRDVPPVVLEQIMKYIEVLQRGGTLSDAEIKRMTTAIGLIPEGFKKLPPEAQTAIMAVIESFKNLEISLGTAKERIAEILKGVSGAVQQMAAETVQALNNLQSNLTTVFGPANAKGIGSGQGATTSLLAGGAVSKTEFTDGTIVFNAHPGLIGTPGGSTVAGSFEDALRLTGLSGLSDASREMVVAAASMREAARSQEITAAINSGNALTLFEAGGLLSNSAETYGTHTGEFGTHVGEFGGAVTEITEVKEIVKEPGPVGQAFHGGGIFPEDMIATGRSGRRIAVQKGEIVTPPGHLPASGGGGGVVFNFDFSGARVDDIGSFRREVVSAVEEAMIRGGIKGVAPST